MIFTGFYGMVEWREFGIINYSKFCQGSVVFPFTKSEIMSLEFFDTTQKNGGDFHHPISNSVVTTCCVLPR